MIGSSEVPFRAGFEHADTSDIEFDDKTRQFKLVCLHKYSVWIGGVVSLVDKDLTVNIPDSSGLFAIVLTKDLRLQVNTPKFAMSNDWIFVAHLYWNSVQQKCLILADERHKICLDIATHAYLHSVFGAQYMNGFDIGNYDLSGDKNLNSSCTFTLTGGEYADEDIYFTVTRSPIKVPYHQDLAIIDSLASGKSWWYCQLPVFYLIGEDKIWFCWETLSPVPFIVVEGVPQINGWSKESSWHLMPAPKDTYFPVFVVATANKQFPVLALTAQKWYISKSLALQQNEAASLRSVGLWFDQEVVFLYRLLYRCSPGCGNEFGAYLVQVTDLRRR